MHSMSILDIYKWKNSKINPIKSTLLHILFYGENIESLFPLMFKNITHYDLVQPSCHITNLLTAFHQPI